YVGLGLIALENSNLSDAEIAFKVARRLDSRCAEAYCGLGTVYHRREAFSEAYETYLKALELDMNSLTAILGLAIRIDGQNEFPKVGQGRQ
ncbi:MAG: hypothetical protein ABIG61_10080, partial [Planctomycetota bacterium]